MRKRWQHSYFATPRTETTYPTPLPQPPVRKTSPSCRLARSRDNLPPSQSTITLSHPCPLLHSTIRHTLSPLACVFILSPVMITTLTLQEDPRRRLFERGRESHDQGLLAAPSGIQRQGNLKSNRIQEQVSGRPSTARVPPDPPQQRLQRGFTAHPPAPDTEADILDNGTACERPGSTDTDRTDRPGTQDTENSDAGSWHRDHRPLPSPPPLKALASPSIAGARRRTGDRGATGSSNRQRDVGTSGKSRSMVATREWFDFHRPRATRVRAVPRVDDDRGSVCGWDESPCELTEVAIEKGPAGTQGLLGPRS